ncbi:hypothetical protein ABI_30830 [Asticcacaulis biprosthecium C19]|uniref:Uncharacterized protein n=1 Tax=Asticcacaulis biprosthecium C19 TaxID=715226 RepID=F4QN75_9CAUL|nr:hypothetical protein ABI_30830 [Asticcacaulis biprosthecium C19]
MRIALCAKSTKVHSIFRHIKRRSSIFTFYMYGKRVLVMS